MANSTNATPTRDPNYPTAMRGDLVYAPRGLFSSSQLGSDTRGVYIGLSPAGNSWVRWLGRDLRTSSKVRSDVALMSARLDRMLALAVRSPTAREIATSDRLRAAE